MSSEEYAVGPSAGGEVTGRASGLTAAQPAATHIQQIQTIPLTCYSRVISTDYPTKPLRLFFDVMIDSFEPSSGPYYSRLVQPCSNTIGRRTDGREGTSLQIRPIFCVRTR